MSSIDRIADRYRPSVDCSVCPQREEHPLGGEDALDWKSLAEEILLGIG